MSTHPLDDYDIGISEGRAIIRDIEQLEATIVRAWQERAVVLSQSEQHDLRDQIRNTCSMLSSLVSSS